MAVSNSAARIPMTAMTTSSSISVNAEILFWKGVVTVKRYPISTFATTGKL